MGNSLYYAWNDFEENDEDDYDEDDYEEDDYEEDHEDDLGPTGHGDICMSDADPGL